MDVRAKYSNQVRPDSFLKPARLMNDVDCAGLLNQLVKSFCDLKCKVGSRDRNFPSPKYSKCDPKHVDPATLPEDPRDPSREQQISEALTARVLCGHEAPACRPIGMRWRPFDRCHLGCRVAESPKK